MVGGSPRFFPERQQQQNNGGALLEGSFKGDVHLDAICPRTLWELKRFVFLAKTVADEGTASFIFCRGSGGETRCWQEIDPIDRENTSRKKYNPTFLSITPLSRTFLLPLSSTRNPLVHTSIRRCLCLSTKIATKALTKTDADLSARAL